MSQKTLGEEINFQGHAGSVVTEEKPGDRDSEDRAPCRLPPCSASKALTPGAQGREAGGIWGQGSTGCRRMALTENPGAGAGGWPCTCLARGH